MKIIPTYKANIVYKKGIIIGDIIPKKCEISITHDTMYITIISPHNNKRYNLYTNNKDYINLLKSTNNKVYIEIEGELTEYNEIIRVWENSSKKNIKSIMQEGTNKLDQSGMLLGIAKFFGREVDRKVKYEKKDISIAVKEVFNDIDNRFIATIKALTKVTSKEWEKEFKKRKIDPVA